MKKRRIASWALIAIAFIGSSYAAAYALVRNAHTENYGDGVVTWFHVRSQADLSLVWAMMPALQAERLLGGRDAVIVDYVSSQTYFLSESLPPLIADPNDRDRGNHC